MKAEIQEISKSVKVIKLGMGEVVCNWGTHGGVPAVFIEPVVGLAGKAGQKVEDGREKQIRTDAVSDGSVVIEIHGEVGLRVLAEDLWSAFHDYNSKHPEPLRCSDCELHFGKSVCVMNCGPVDTRRVK